MNIKKIKSEFSEQGLVYAPNSVYHGSSVKSLSDKAALTVEVNRLSDFIEFLFEHSDHCDHITQSEAWKEFEIYEVKNKPFCLKQ